MSLKLWLYQQADSVTNHLENYNHLTRRGHRGKVRVFLAQTARA
jgi:hypothetical protein